MVERDDTTSARGLETLLGEAWEECGRRGRMPAAWTPFDPARAEGAALRERGKLLGYVAIRPTVGMDSIEFLYARRDARRDDVLDSLIATAVARLREVGLTRIIYAGYGWWRAPFPDVFARAFARAGFGRFEGVFLVRPLERGGPEAAPVPPGYEVVDWRDDFLDEVCDVMLASPEPEALYWDMDLCRRSILNAAFPSRPLFPDGFGQVAFHAGRVAGFTLASRHGYVNHVYTHPEHRGKGLAPALVTRLLRALARKGIERVSILTHDTNPRAVAIYERLGFAIDFCYPQFYQKR